MGTLDLGAKLAKIGMKPGVRFKVGRVVISPETGTVAQIAQKGANRVKVTSYAEGNLMHNLGITDALTFSNAGKVDKVCFFRNPNGKFLLQEYGCCDKGSKLFSGTVDEAKGFIKALKEMAANGVKLFD